MAAPQQIGSLDVVLTDRCNLRCGYCYQNDKNPRRMEWGTLRGALDMLLASERDELDLVFYGGEPLLEFERIRQAVAHVRDRLSPGKTVTYTISTNGLLLTDEIVDFLVEHDFRTQLSFDGVPAAQDVRGSNSFPKLDALLERLRRHRPAFFRERLKIAITLTAATIDALAASIEYFLRKGVQSIDITPVFTHYAEWRPEHYASLDRQFARVHEHCLAHYRRTGEVPLNLFRKQAELAPSSGNGRTMCGVPRGDALAVDVDGQVHGCVTLADSYQRFRTRFLQEKADAMRLGDFRDPSFSERLKLFPEATRSTEIFHSKQDKYSSYGRCGECRYLDVCMVCPVSIGHIPGNTDPRRVPDFPCAFQMISYAHRERFPLQPGPAELLRDDAALPDLMTELMERTPPRTATGPGTVR